MIELMMNDPDRIYVCDLPSKYDALKETYKGVTPSHEARLISSPLFTFRPHRRPCNYGLTRWTSRLQSLGLYHVFG